MNRCSTRPSWPGTTPTTLDSPRVFSRTRKLYGADWCDTVMTGARGGLTLRPLLPLLRPAEDEAYVEVALPPIPVEEVEDEDEPTYTPTFHLGAWHVYTKA